MSLVELPRLGDLTERVTLTRLVPAEDGKGGQVAPPVPLSPPVVWADVQDSSGPVALRLLGPQLQAVASHVVVLPYHRELAALPLVQVLQVRVTWGDRVLQVVGRGLRRRQDALVLACTETTP